MLRNATLRNWCLIRCLEKAQKIGTTLDVEKCKFKETELVTINGIEPDENKIKSILEMPKPEEKDVQRLLGLINYVGKFIHNLSELIAPLKELLVKNKPWQWGKSQNQSFERIKELLVSKKCLAYCNVQKPVKIQVDVSKSGIGAVFTGWQTNCICIKVSDSNATKICTNWAEDVSSGIWMSKISPVHIWKESDNTEWSQTTRSNSEETTTEYTSTIANNVTQFTEIWYWFGVSGWERKHLRRYLIMHTPGRDHK